MGFIPLSPWGNSLWEECWRPSGSGFVAWQSSALASLLLEATRTFFLVTRSGGIMIVFCPTCLQAWCASGGKLLLAANVTVLVQIQLEFFVLLLLRGLQGC